ncbi:MAG: HisA/HisF-related TIM barrel protein [Thermoproteota archaeon]
MAERKLAPIVRNTAALGILASVFGIDFKVVEDVIRHSIRRSVEENVEVADEVYEMAGSHRGTFRIPILGNSPRPLLSGNEAIALGAVRGGLKLYVAYPMTPSSSILHYLAANAEAFKVAVVHPENEIAVIGMAEGAAYAGVRSMVGTSGGGFALMVEHLNLSGQAEIPIVIYLGQRPGPSMGVSKISVNTAAVKRPELINEASRKFGKGRIIVAIDGRRNLALPSGFEVVIDGGTRGTGIDVVEWAKRCEKLGAGEILATSIEVDGTLSGYDIQFTRAITDAVNLPIIASGGAGTLEHLYEAVVEGKANTLLAASIFHFRKYSISDAKRYLRSRGLEVRI